MTTVTPTGHPVPNKFATALWFAARPYTYAHLLEMLRRRFARDLREKEDSRSEATEWAEPRALSWREALEVFGIEEPHPWREEHASLLVEANKRAQASPVQMGGAGALDLLFNLVRYRAAASVMETGVAYGWSSLTMLLAQKKIFGARLVSTDMPYPRAYCEASVGCVVPDDMRSGWTLIRRPDRPGLPAGLRLLGEVDLVHYDSDKSYAGRMWAYPLVWTHLRSGGLLVSDDIHDNVAFREFSEIVEIDPIVVSGEEKFIGILEKPT